MKLSGIHLVLATLGVLVVVLACGSGEPEVVEVPATESAEDSVEGATEVSFPDIPTPPDLDLYALAEAFGLSPDGAIPRLAAIDPHDEAIGVQRTFWIVDLDKRKPFQVSATLRYISPHLYMYVEDGRGVSEEDLAEAAREFEEVIYPAMAARFGGLPNAEEDGVGRLTVLHARIPAVAGYYNPADEYPSLINRYSNERRMMYINLDAAWPGTAYYSSVLTHELQHAVHAVADPTEEGWINEGLSTLSEEIADPQVAWYLYYRDEPDTQLTGWGTDPGTSGKHYGAAYLFMKYFSQHYSGPNTDGGISALVSQQADGIEGINAYLSESGYQADFDKVFKDWVVANYLDKAEGGIHSYEDLDFRLPTTRRATDYGRISGAVPQYAAHYLAVSLKQGSARIVFHGTPQTRLLHNQAHSGSWQWWSNQGDAINSTLTREVDLLGHSEARLDFWAWYDIEDDFDFAYVVASTDGGRTWDILRGNHSTDDTLLGNSFGPSYSGVSGDGENPEWVFESIDLSPYAGQKVLVRFQYVTDGAVNIRGLAIDDISISAVGFEDDVEQEDGGWTAEGFVRIPDRVPQSFSVQAIHFGDTVSVSEVPLSAGQRGELTVHGFGSEIDEVVLVIAGTTPFTNELASYYVSVLPVSDP